MRRTLFWTGVYCTAAFFIIGMYNVWYDQVTRTTLQSLGHPTFSEALKIVTDNQQQVINNQQLTHVLAIAIVIFLLVRFYYEKHPSESPARAIMSSMTKTKEEITFEHPDISKDYYEDPKKKSVEDRKQDIVNHDHDDDDNNNKNNNNNKNKKEEGKGEGQR
jgi:hypothetical protein